MPPNSLIIPQWPAPAHIKAFSTTRCGGVSRGAYQGFNLGLHVGDDAADVLINRSQLHEQCQLPAEPKWLQQIHSNLAIAADDITDTTQVDASYTITPHKICVIMTADCLPILVTDVKGNEVAAIHAGWRGLANGIVENTLAQLQTPTTQLMAWLGPAIGPQHYEVGDEVYQQFNTNQHQVAGAFTPYHGKWLANMPLLAIQRLRNCGIEQIYNSAECTYSNPAKYFSYRRDGVTGRMASMIWIE